MISELLLEVLACPACQSPVQKAGTKIVCTDPQCGLRFPIRDEIPVMLTDEAERPTGRGRC